MNARISNKASLPAGSGATTPMSRGVMRKKSGFRASSSSRECSMTATQPGPLSTHCEARIALRSRPKLRVTAASVAASTSPLRRSGGAANARRLPSRRTRTRPTPHCCTISSRERGLPPAASHA
jgi:hypothetical protein